MKSDITVDITLDKRYQKEDETYPVKLRVTFQRKQRYYSCNCDLTCPQYERVMSAKPSKEEKAVNEYLIDLKAEMRSIIKNLPQFSFDRIKSLYKAYLKNEHEEDIPTADTEVKSPVFDLFDVVIAKSEKEGRVGTADVLTCAKNSLRDFKPNLKFKDITVSFLEDYEQWFVGKGNSITTVGIYLRSLRSIYNVAASLEYNLISWENYPFNNKSNPKGYKIPRGNNIKKALSTAEIKMIMDHPLKAGSPEDRARDFWYFTYLNNGINFKDIAHLKYKDIYKKQIHFNRAKTTRSTRDKDRTVISALLSESERIIEKWGNEDKDPENFVFPILQKDISARRAHEIHQTHLQTINKFNKRLAKSLSLGVSLTTMVARHSFASIMIENGVDLAIIKELMGHSSITTTEIYVKPFNSKSRRKTAELLRI